MRAPGEVLGEEARRVLRPCCPECVCPLWAQGAWGWLQRGQWSVVWQRKAVLCRGGGRQSALLMWLARGKTDTSVGGGRVEVSGAV